jgi:uncharacterized protein (DUF302 family)
MRFSLGWRRDRSRFGLGFLAALFVAALVTNGLASAADQKGGYQPFVEGVTLNQSLADATKKVTSELTKAGFEVVGQYSPLKNVTILSISSPDMLKNAEQTDRGGYGAALSVALENAGGKTMVSYVNPPYLANGYQMAGDNADVAAALAKAIGKVKTFGAKPRTAKKLRNYQYAFGMETFTDPMDMGTFNGFNSADRTITSRLKEGKDGVSLIYRIKIPGKNQIVYGVRLNSSNDDANGVKLVQSVDGGAAPHRYAFLPYEVLLDGRHAEALNLRFRMALFFPDLPMLGGDASFFKLRSAPDAIKSVLSKALGGKLPEANSGGGSGFENFNNF